MDHLITNDNQVTGVALTAFKASHPGQHSSTSSRYDIIPTRTQHTRLTRQVRSLVLMKSADVLPEVLAESGLSLYTTRLPVTSMILLDLGDNQVEFFQDVNVRKALMKELNRQGMIENLRNSQAILADGPIFPGTSAYYDGITHYTYNPNDPIALSAKQAMLSPLKAV